ncbi:hypothetical protein C6P45_004543 [Maudiozyma exigua]|uniref:Endoplasmic reticulum junction formation protein lunapark n=1 Tax=Maudiozyma exigua TaxID=34358 RepID=A0A9P6WAI2_MAUEX|nr:hypothetical protein C6P45_004543 [Kazachstania exigua]
MMFGKIGRLLFRDKRTVVQRYTQDLSQITSDIHILEKNLQRGQLTNDSIQSSLSKYGIAIIVLILSYLYVNPTKCFSNWTQSIRLSVVCVIGIVVLILIKWISSYLYGKYQSYQYKKLNKLKGIHQKKLNELKKETNFHETNSIIQRFSSGEDQSEDAMILIDEELKDKYVELTNLKKELEMLKQKDDNKKLNRDEKDVWFDKVIGVLAGGNDLDNLPKPIICPNCQKHSGAYRILGKPILYICPYCQFKIGENDETVETLPKEDETTVTTKSASPPKDKTA